MKRLMKRKTMNMIVRKMWSMTEKIEFQTLGMEVGSVETSIDKVILIDKMVKRIVQYFDIINLSNSYLISLS